MTEFVRFTLEDGSQVLFESAEADLVALHGGEPSIQEGGRLTKRLHAVAQAAEEIAGELRSRLAPDQVNLEFGLKVSGELNWWFVAKSQGESTIKVTLTWVASQPPPASAIQPDADDAEPAPAAQP